MQSHEQETEERPVCIEGNNKENDDRKLNQRDP